MPPPRLLVERRHLHVGAAGRVVAHGHAPRLAAHLAVLDVVLRPAAAGIERDVHRLAAVRAVHGRRGVRGAVAAREIGVDVFLGKPFQESELLRNIAALMRKAVPVD